MKVSLIIPCYNVEEYIVECLESAYFQTYDNIEVIAVDNNSSDNTASLLKEFRKKQPSLRILIESKKGACAARNKGLSHATGGWVQFLDADDLLEPNKIAHQVDLVNSDVPFIAAASVKRPLYGDEYIMPVAAEYPFFALFAATLGNTVSNLWNRSFLDRVGGWNEELMSSQETDLMFRILQISDAVIMDQYPLTIVRERSHGQISNNSLGNKERYIEIRKQILHFLFERQDEHLQFNESKYYQILFNSLRGMAQIDPDVAESYFRELFTFCQIWNANGRSRIYQMAAYFLGLKTCEKIRGKITKNQL